VIPATDKVEALVESLSARICQGVIAFPKDLKVEATFSGASLTKYVILCHSADCPRILGKGGERFRGLRLLMGLVGASHGRQINFDSVKVTKREPAPPFPKCQYNPDWPRQKVLALMQDICQAVMRCPVKVRLEETPPSAVLVVRYDGARRLPELDVICVTRALQNMFSGIGATNGCQLGVDFGPEEQTPTTTTKKCQTTSKSSQSAT
jgi:predicted RNA-binding protein YlqC (UPF0109 family)